MSMNATNPEGRETLPETIDTVIFDLDGTLRHNEPSGIATFQEFAAELGVPSDSDQRKSAERWLYRYWADSEDLNRDRAHTADDERKFWLIHAARHLQLLGAPDEKLEELADALVRRMQEEYEFVDHVPSDVPVTLRQLSRLGYRLGLLSNRHEPLDELVRAIGLDSHFGMTLAAGEVGWWKPDPRIFQFAAQRIGSQPAHTLYVGDNYYADILGARSAGMPAVLVDPGNLFPEADCPIIRRIGELPSLLNGGGRTD